MSYSLHFKRNVKRFIIRKRRTTALSIHSSDRKQQRITVIQVRRLQCHCCSQTCTLHSNNMQKIPKKTHKIADESLKGRSRYLINYLMFFS